MSDMALERDFASGKLRERLFGTQKNRQGSAFYGYSLTLIAIGAGWLLRDGNLVNPEQGLGYWLGVAGGSILVQRQGRHDRRLVSGLDPVVGRQPAPAPSHCLDPQCISPGNRLQFSL